MFSSQLSAKVLLGANFVEEVLRPSFIFLL